MSERLTGRRRYRLMRKWLRSYLVLQVEVEGTIFNDYGSHGECFRGTWWIDARPEHLTESEEIE